MKLKLLILLIVSQFGIAQHRTCGMQEKMAQMMSNPVFKKQYEERQAKFEVEYKKLLNKQTSTDRFLSPNATIIIPVAVHFPSVSNASSAAIKTCFREFAQTQIDVINADYNAANSDLSNWTSASTFYPGVNVGNMNVQFIIATQNHPAGTGIANGTTAVTFGTDFLSGADSDATWAGYMNFVVRDEGTQILGYSPLGGSPAAGQTVVMNTFCYGTGTGCTGYVPQSPFHLGRTVTHELGHFFNLDHTFASSGCNPAGANCATEGDSVCDTPRLTSETYGCPAAGSVNACATLKSLTMNYMDYVDDPCMYMFTAGQATRALAYINTILSEFKPNVLGTDSFTRNSFEIFPNPNKGSFTIQLDELNTNYSIQVVDQSGRIVYDKNAIINADLLYNVDLNSVASGVYFVKVKTENATVVKKILVE